MPSQCPTVSSRPFVVKGLRHHKTVNFLSTKRGRCRRTTIYNKGARWPSDTFVRRGCHTVSTGTHTAWRQRDLRLCSWKDMPSDYCLMPGLAIPQFPALPSGSALTVTVTVSLIDERAAEARASIKLTTLRGIFCSKASFHQVKCCTLFGQLVSVQSQHDLY